MALMSLHLRELLGAMSIHLLAADEWERYMESER